MIKRYNPPKLPNQAFGMWKRLGYTRDKLVEKPIIFPKSFNQNKKSMFRFNLFSKHTLFALYNKFEHLINLKYSLNGVLI